MLTTGVFWKRRASKIFGFKLNAVPTLTLEISDAGYNASTILLNHFADIRQSRHNACLLLSAGSGETTAAKELAQK
jgi:hypothetical protein